MSTVETVADSTDWLGTPLASLAPVESSLRCQVCKDFFVTPMITSCSHTFCSLCIRRYLSQEGSCPACRESDQEVRLRRNWVVEELVTHFRDNRQVILDHARRSAVENEPGRPTKRRKLQQHQHLADSERRSTRSQSRRGHDSNGSHPPTTVEVQDSEEGSDYEDQSGTEHKDRENGLVACPICNKKMDEIQINRHLDSNCQDGPEINSPGRSNIPQTKSGYNNHGAGPGSGNINGNSKPVVREKLPTINYSMLSDAGLRKKLREMGIANHGSKELMKRRHVEWVNLWNASCDAQNPMPILQLRRDLDQWERTLGRQLDRGPSGVMVKDFDRDGWQKSNKGEFDDLIRQAKERTAARKLKEAKDAEAVSLTNADSELEAGRPTGSVGNPFDSGQRSVLHTFAPHSPNPSVSASQQGPVVVVNGYGQPHHSGSIGEGSSRLS